MRSPPESFLNPEFVFADCGHEFFQIERLEVSHILEILFGETFLRQVRHVRCERVDTVHERYVRVGERLLAFGCAVSETDDLLLLKDVGVGIFVDDVRRDFPFQVQFPIEQCGVYLHSSGVDHRA